MSKNKIIQVSIWLTRSVIFLIGLALLLFTVLVIHWHFDKTFYQHWYLKNEFNAGLDSLAIHISGKESIGISLSELNNIMMYWLLLRNVVIMILVVIILFKVVRFLKSVRKVKTFYDENIRTFQVIARISFLLAAISFVNFGTVDGVTTTHFMLPYRPLLFAFGALVLSEVFKEGKALLEDSKSII